MDGELGIEMGQNPADPNDLAPEASIPRVLTGAPPCDVPLKSGAADARRAPDALWVGSTYFAQGLPYSIVHQVSAQLFTAFGRSLGEIGLTSLYGLVWNLKFAWSPVVERTSTTRRWVVGMEIALGIAVAAVAWPAGAGNLQATAWIFGIVAILAATHDVAVDGFYLHGLGRGRQASFSGLRVAAYRAALLVGNGALVALAGRTSWFWCFAVGGAILLVLAFGHARLLPRSEPAAARRSPSRGDAASTVTPVGFFAAFPSFVVRPRASRAIAFILLFRAGDAMMFAMSTPLLKSLGLETTTRGLLSGIGGTAASIAGAMIGALVIARAGLSRVLAPIAWLQSIAITLYAFMAWTQPGVAGIGAIVVVEQLAAGIGTAAFVVFLTRYCVGEHRTSHFAIASAMMSIATTALGSASGYVAEWVGFPLFFTAAFVASIPGVWLARSVPTE